MTELYVLNCVLLVMILLHLSQCRKLSRIGDLRLTNCSLSPPIQSLPCKQFNLKTMLYPTYLDACSDDNLKREFPHLFEVIPDQVSWPGTVIIRSEGSLVSWGSDAYSSVNLLKGFLLNIEGVDMKTNGTVQCIVIDISNRTDGHTLALNRSRFSVDLQHTGHFNVTFRSLPLGENIGSMASTTVFTKEDYQPPSSTRVKRSSSGQSLYVDVVFQSQLNSTRQFDLSIYDENNEKMQNMSRTVSEKFTIEHLEDGEYTIQILPLDETPYDSGHWAICETAICLPCTKHAAANSSSNGPENVRLDPIQTIYTQTENVDTLAAITCGAKADSNTTWAHLNSTWNNNTAVLNLGQVSRNEAGVYRCTVTMSDGRTGTVDVVLIVLFPPSSVELSGTRNIFADGTNNVKLTCTTATANPAATIRWFKNGSPIDNTRQSSETDGDYGGWITSQILYLAPNRDINGDTYRCSCSNTLNAQSPISSQERSLDLKYPILPTSTIQQNTIDLAWLSQILIPIMSLAVVIGLVVFIAWRNCRQTSLSYILKHVLGRGKKKMFLVYTADDTLHSGIISAFIDLLTSLVNIDVIQTQEELLQDDIVVTLESVDIICFVHSKRSYKLHEGVQKGTLNIQSYRNICFLKCMNTVNDNERLSDKTISVYVSRTQEIAAIEDIRGPKLPIMANIDAFLKCVDQRITDLSRKRTSRKVREAKELALEKAIDAYQKSESDSDKMISRECKHGRDETITNKDVNVSSTSRRNDTVTSGTGKKIDKCTDAFYGACASKTAYKHNKPFDIRFYAPDTEQDDISTRFSVLEQAALDINSKYEHWLQLCTDIDGDCLTIGGQSV